jgi:hypothetical protein
MKRSDFVDVLKIGKLFSPGVRSLLHTTEVQIPAYIFWLPRGPPLGRTNGAHVEE